jgi:two-component system alkaline phosphatase synthesis response regulator PhoP
MGYKVLLADDEEDIKSVLKIFLESTGFEVITAYDGLNTIDMAREGKPDIIILDIMMPIVDGFEVCKRLKDDPNTCEIPVIMLSAASHAESIQKGLECGAVDYVIKPIEPETLEALINKTLLYNT